MQNADLSDALMDRAVIVEANLRGAILERAVLTRSDLKDAGARRWRGWLLPWQGGQWRGPGSSS